MVKNDLLPTSENIRKTILEDLLDRNKDLYCFIKILDSIEGNYSIALDSYWGSGKTFFVNQLKMILDAYNKLSYNEIDNPKEIQDRFNEAIESQIKTDYHIAMYYDAWVNDNDSDPILSLVYQMLVDSDAYNSIKDGAVLKKLLLITGEIIKGVKNINIPQIIRNIDSDTNPFDDIVKSKALAERINEFIDNLIPERGERLLIIIDELDRCKPDYAVKLLERIKHYFNNDRVTFVFSVNLLELQHTVKHLYGNEFDACKYLDRFFDLRVQLPNPDVTDYLAAKHNIYNDSKYDNCIVNLIIKKFRLQLREISRFMQLFDLLVKDSSYDIFSSDRTEFLIKKVFLPILIALYITDNSKCMSVINNETIEPLIDFCTDDESIDVIQYYLSFLFSDKSDNDVLTSDELKTKKDEIKAQISLLFNYLFSSGYIYKTVGKCTISDKEKKLFKRSISVLSNSSIRKL